MIFVTVGTHEQQFNRLVEYMDDWAYEHNERVVIQTGFCTYEPKYCVWKKLYSYQEMNSLVKEARIVITHGGPSSFIAPLQIGKVPIVIPRRKEFDEHVNNHQVDFVRAVEERMGNIVVVDDVQKLGDVIKKKDDIKYEIGQDYCPNNDYFCKRFGDIVDEMFGYK